MHTALAQHAGLRNFMARRKLSASAIRRDGRLTLVIDQRCRIHLRPDVGGQLCLSASVAALPGGRGTPAARQFVERMLNAGAGLLREHASTLYLEVDGDSLQLQQLLAADLSADQLDAEIGDFANTLQFWQKTGLAS